MGLAKYAKTMFDKDRDCKGKRCKKNLFEEMIKYKRGSANGEFNSLINLFRNPEEKKCAKSYSDLDKI